MQIEFSKSAVKSLQKMDSKQRMRMKTAIEGLMSEPPKGDIKPMEGKATGRYRLRVGGYRVIYQYEENEEKKVIVLAVGTRGDIYK